MGKLDLQTELRRLQMGVPGFLLCQQALGTCALGLVRGNALPEELGAPARHEDSWRHRNPQAAELSPAEDLLQWDSALPPPDHLFEFLGRRRAQ